MIKTSKVEIYNGSNRQIWIDVTGEGLPEKIFAIGIRETLILEINDDQIDRIKSTLPTSVLFQK